MYSAKGPNSSKIIEDSDLNNADSECINDPGGTQNVVFNRHGEA